MCKRPYIIVKQKLKGEAKTFDQLYREEYSNDWCQEQAITLSQVFLPVKELQKTVT